jgi:membrane-bound metal-dependent hydrolase YbcI (DUF457 family)
MFLGHIAVGFAAKRAAPRTSLGWLMAAPILLDLLWPIFVLLGWEHFRIEPGNTKFTPLAFDSYPWSHSLLMSVVWATAMAGLYYTLKKEPAGTVAIWLGVISHWVLDFATHRPDMPLYPGGPVLGLGLWNHVAATMVVEFAMFGGALWIYTHETRARDGVGRWAFWGFVAFMVLAYLGNMGSPPPPSTQAIAYVGLATWLFVPWAGWFDRRRGR